MILCNVLHTVRSTDKVIPESDSLKMMILASANRKLQRLWKPLRCVKVCVVRTPVCAYSYACVVRAGRGHIRWEAAHHLPLSLWATHNGLPKFQSFWSQIKKYAHTRCCAVSISSIELKFRRSVAFLIIRGKRNTSWMGAFLIRPTPKKIQGVSFHCKNTSAKSSKWKVLGQGSI